MRLGRVEVSAGGLLVAALLYYFDPGGAAGWVLLACLCHELGHLGAIRALGGRVSRLRLSWAGAELRLSPARPLSAGQLAAAALAGPGVNLLLALLADLLARRGLGERLFLFAGVNLALALFNLLPAGGLDGGRALESLLALAGREEAGRRLTRWGVRLAAGGLLAAGAGLFWESEGRNFTLLAAGAWLLLTQGREEPCP